MVRRGSSSSAPTQVGEGDRAAQQRGGGGAGLHEPLSTTTKRRVRSPLHHASRGPPPPHACGGGKQVSVLAAPVLRPSYLHGTKTGLQTNKGRRSAERRVLRDRSAQSSVAARAGSRRAPLLADALAFRRSTAALARGLSPKGSIRSRASWWRTTDPRPGKPAPGRPTFASRASFRTARRWSYEPHPGHRSRSHQSAVTG